MKQTKAVMTRWKRRWLTMTGQWVTCRCWKCGWGLAGERRHVMDEFTRHINMHA